MGLFANLLNWLRGRVRPKGYSPPYLEAENQENWEPFSEDNSSEVMLAEYYDKHLFERARTQWQFGDWESLARIERESLYHHPQRASLALLAAAGHQQLGNMEDTRDFTRLAREWGATKKMISQVLIAGVYNTLGKASALCGQQQRAIGHFKKSLNTSGDEGDIRLLSQARAEQQVRKYLEIEESNKILTMDQSYTSVGGNTSKSNNLLRYAKGPNNEPLSHNPSHQFAANHALCHYPSGAVYSFIPKNGCTTFRYSFAIANKCIQGPGDFEWIHQNNDTFRASLQELVNAPYTFVILRCPYTRLASLYLDKIVNQKDVVSALNEININNVDPGSLSFRDFVELLSSEGALEKNHHWKPQVRFLVYQDYSDWFRMENFLEAVQTVGARIGLEVHDTRNLAKHGTDQYRLIHGDYVDTPAHEILSLQKDGISPSHASLYNDELIDKVAALYSKDIELYENRFGIGSLGQDSKVLNHRHPS
jgi:hypothetical protein